jgi:hypothetical protein
LCQFFAYHGEVRQVRRSMADLARSEIRQKVSLSDPVAVSREKYGASITLGWLKKV